MIHFKLPSKSLFLVVFIIVLAAGSAGCGSGGHSSSAQSDPNALFDFNEYPDPPMPTGDLSYSVTSLIDEGNILMSDSFLQNILHNALAEPDLAQGFMDATKLIIRNFNAAISDSLISEAWLPIGSTDSQPRQVKLDIESIKLFERVLYKNLQDAGVSTDSINDSLSEALKKTTASIQRRYIACKRHLRG